MHWIIGIQNALDFIEENLTEDITVEEIAKRCYASTFHFQRVFGILCGYTVGEYMRNRRLSRAGAELNEGNQKVIDVALKYGYSSPDSFAKAFVAFHGITPSAARIPGAQLRSFSRLNIKLYLEGGSNMNYRIETKQKTRLLGYKRRFEGIPGNDEEQEVQMWLNTRANQYLLQGVAKDPTLHYTVTIPASDGGYDFYIATELREEDWAKLKEDSFLGEADATRFEEIPIQAQTYAVFETEKEEFPTRNSLTMHKKIISEWLPSSEYVLANAPEIQKIHWHRKPNKKNRFIELWIPIEKKK
ncbi:MAG: AraC family transcriptional regulator [Clostridia bacterium]|nr:AraC family transcriptional regulator [Clostridia bacterium]